MTDTKVLEVRDLKKSYKTVTSVAGDFIMSLDAGSLVAVQNTEESSQIQKSAVPKKSKPFFKSSAGNITLGALVLGAASGIVLGLASSSGGSSAASASFSGPVPSVPGN
jgi:hypothetical protein